MFEWLQQILTRLQGYNPLEVLVEIALIWGVVYLIWRFLRGTRGARVLKGSVLVLVVSMVVIATLGANSQWFVRLQFLLEKFVIGASFALAIVFQPELRRALVRIGETRLFRASGMDLDAVIEQVIQAVEDMSRNRIGAIIAFEREVGLSGIVEIGTRLEARVSAALLKTIFWPGTVLHDMGVVIQGDKILAAGVQFPLVEDSDVGQELGSRHRAAIGLSQEADCLVLVVSEETGAISLAERGQLLRKLSVDGLRSMLRRGLSHSEVLAPSASVAEAPSRENSEEKDEDTAADRSAA